MALDTAATIATLRGLTQKFDLGVTSSSPFYPTLCTVVNSTGSDEEYGALGSVPGMREWLGDRVFHSLRGAKFTIENREWESSVKIERNDIEDARLAKYEPVIQQLGTEAVHHPDELLFELIIDGENQPCFDGQLFFDTDHAWGDSGTQSNDLTSTCVSAAAPTEAEFRKAYHAARSAMLSFKRDNGKLWHRPMLTPVNDLLLLVPPSLQEVATRALTAPLVNGGETNIVLDVPRIVAVPYLSTASKFYLFRTGQPLKPFIFQNRRPLARMMKGMDDREFKDVKFMTDARYNCGYFAWWNACLMQLVNA